MNAPPAAHALQRTTAAAAAAARREGGGGGGVEERGGVVIGRGGWRQGLRAHASRRLLARPSIDPRQNESWPEKSRPARRLNDPPLNN